MQDYRAPVRAIDWSKLGLLLLPDGGLQAGGARFIPSDFAAAMAAARQAARWRGAITAEQRCGVVRLFATMQLPAASPRSGGAARELVQLLAHVIAAIALTEQDGTR